MKYMQIKVVVVSLLVLLTSCYNSTTLSDEEANNILNYRAKVEIVDSDKKDLEKIKVHLYNHKGKEIINKNLKVLINSEPLNLFVRTGNYYDKYAHYSATDLSRKESYYFEIILPDSTKHPVAFIKPDKITSKFEFPHHVKESEDFVISYSNLNAAYQIEYIRGVERKRSEANIKEYGYKGRTEDTLKIKNEQQYRIPKTYFVDSLRTQFLEIKLTGTQTGLTNPDLLNSTIEYNHIIEKVIYAEGYE